MKKIFLLALLSVLLAGNMQAQSVLSIGSVNVCPDSVVLIPVSISNLGNLGAFSLYVNYDPAVLIPLPDPLNTLLININPGLLSTGYLVWNPMTNPTTVGISWFSTGVQPFPMSTATLFYLQFRYASSAVPSQLTFNMVAPRRTELYDFTTAMMINAGITFTGGSVSGSPVPVTNYTSFIQVPSGTSTMLTGSVSSGAPFTYSWSPCADLAAGNCNLPNPTTVNLYANTAYILSVTNSYGCSAVASVTVDTVSTPGYLNSVEGFVNYDNSLNSPMTNTTVLLKQNGTVVAQTTTDASGYYAFQNVLPGIYSLGASTTKPYTGGNAADALLILRHFVGMTQLTGLRLKAADVNVNGYVNTSDALSTAQHFVGIIPVFPGGEWVFSSATVTIVAGGTVVQNIKALCMGDVDGSGIPAN